jgi:hypothetical protein
MMRFFRPLVVVLAAVLLLPAALRADVHDNASIFSPAAVDKANTDLAAMHRRHNKDLVIETFASVPDDQKSKLQSDGKDAFFASWLSARAKELSVNGVYVLICMDPKHVQVAAGKETRARGDFTENDVKSLREHLQKSLGAKQYDQALGDAVEDVDRAYTANIAGQGPPSRAGQTPNYNSNNGGNYPAIPNYSPTHSTGFGTMASLICLAVGVIIIVSIIRSIFRGQSGGGYGGSGFGGGGYGGNYPPPQAGYGSGPGYGSGGGSGFGRGFLGGLLGGALGGYAENRFEGRNDAPSNPSSQPGWGDTSGGGGGGGGSFDAGPSDAGGGFDSGGSGGDFGGGGGGGDSGGGGGSSGGDF